MTGLDWYRERLMEFSQACLGLANDPNTGPESCRFLVRIENSLARLALKLPERALAEQRRGGGTLQEAEKRVLRRILMTFPKVTLKNLVQIARENGENVSDELLAMAEFYGDISGDSKAP